MSRAIPWNPKKRSTNQNREYHSTSLKATKARSHTPTIKIDCEKCGNDEAVWWMLQTRSADEPTTQFYRCTKCKHTWRNYA